MEDQISLPYVPIVMQFVEGVVTDSRLTKAHRSYKLSITQEATNNTGLFQALPQQYVITVPTSGVVKLKLLVLNPGREKQAPINRYRVHYYSTEGEWLDDQFWVIPDVNIPKRVTTVNNDGLGSPIELPINLFEITQMTPEVQYSVIDNMIYFDNSAAVGEYTIEYQPGLSLYDIVYKA